MAEPHQIEFTGDAERHLDAFTAREIKILLSKIEEQLVYQPEVATRNRKLLRENPLATWELRVQKFRVFYNVEEDRNVVVILAIGVKKGTKFFIDGEEYLL